MQVLKDVLHANEPVITDVCKKSKRKVDFKKLVMSHSFWGSLVSLKELMEPFHKVWPSISSSLEFSFLKALQPQAMLSVLHASKLLPSAFLCIAGDAGCPVRHKQFR